MTTAMTTTRAFPGFFLCVLRTFKIDEAMNLSVVQLYIDNAINIVVLHNVMNIVVLEKNPRVVVLDNAMNIVVLDNAIPEQT